MALPWTAIAAQDVSTHAASYHTQPYSDRQPANKNRPEPADQQYQTTDSRQAEDKSPQAIAIETLKQRSRGGSSENIHPDSAHTDHLIAQELYRLEVQANIINEQSQRQADAILSLKRSAQQAAIGLARQGVQDHPQIAIISQFLAQYPSAAVPHIERNSQGHFALSYQSVDFQSAQKEAMRTAHNLRNRPWQANKPNLRDLQEELFSQPVPGGSATHKDSFEWHEQDDKRLESNQIADSASATRPAKNRLQKSLGNSIDKVLYLFGQNKHRKRKVTELSAELTEGLELGHTYSDVEEGFIRGEGTHTDDPIQPISPPFSWLDGTIWFSGAAIARIVVQTIALSYPIVQTLFVILLAGSITFALYRVVIARSSDYGIIYKLCIVMAGLLLASLFS